MLRAGALGVFVWEPQAQAQPARAAFERQAAERAAPDSESAAGVATLVKRFKPEFSCNCAFEVRCRSDAYCRRKHSPAHRCLLSCCGLRCSDADPEWAPPPPLILILIHLHLRLKLVSFVCVPLPLVLYRSVSLTRVPLPQTAARVVVEYLSASARPAVALLASPFISGSTPAVAVPMARARTSSTREWQRWIAPNSARSARAHICSSYASSSSSALAIVENSLVALAAMPRWLRPRSLLFCARIIVLIVLILILILLLSCVLARGATLCHIRICQLSHLPLPQDSLTATLVFVQLQLIHVIRAVVAAPSYSFDLFALHPPRQMSQISLSTLCVCTSGARVREIITELHSAHSDTAWVCTPAQLLVLIPTANRQVRSCVLYPLHRWAQQQSILASRVASCSQLEEVGYRGRSR